MLVLARHVTRGKEKLINDVPSAEAESFVAYCYQTARGCRDWLC